MKFSFQPEDETDTEPTEQSLFEELLYFGTAQGQVFSTPPVEIPGLEGARPLTLYLPPDYEENPEQLYPVAYLFDGQNLYDRDEGPLGWNLHQILDARHQQELVVPVVVGIHHGWNRDEELCPWPAEKGQTPRGDFLLDWIINSLDPQIRREIRILDGPENRLVGGSSLGGLLALYAGFRAGNFFGRIMSMSPSLWVGDGALYHYIAHFDHLPGLDWRLYLDCGALEGEDEAWDEGFWWPEENKDNNSKDEAETEPKQTQTPSKASAKAVSPPTVAPNTVTAQASEDSPPESEEEWETDPLEDAEYLVDILLAKGLLPGPDFIWVPDPEGEHNEWHWSKRLPLALAYLLDGT